MCGTQVHAIANLSTGGRTRGMCPPYMIVLQQVPIVVELYPTHCTLLFSVYNIEKLGGAWGRD